MGLECKQSALKCQSFRRRSDFKRLRNPRGDLDLSLSECESNVYGLHEGAQGPSRIELTGLSKERLSDVCAPEADLDICGLDEPLNL